MGLAHTHTLKLLPRKSFSWGSTANLLREDCGSTADPLRENCGPVAGELREYCGPTVGVHSWATIRKVVVYMDTTHAAWE